MGHESLDDELGVQPSWGEASDYFFRRRFVTRSLKQWGLDTQRDRYFLICEKFTAS